MLTHASFRFLCELHKRDGKSKKRYGSGGAEVRESEPVIGKMDKNLGGCGEAPSFPPFQAF